MKANLFFGLIVLIIISGCHRLKEDGSLKTDKKISPCFGYTSSISGSNKFITFYKDSVVWGCDSRVFKSYYGTCYEMDDLKPSEYTSGYDVRFTKNYIIVGIGGKNSLVTESLGNSGTTQMFFSLLDGNNTFRSRIYSIDYKHEYLLLNEEGVTQNIHPKYPLVISKFPHNGKNKFQTIDIAFDNDSPSSINKIEWSKDTLTISYNDSKGIVNSKKFLIKI